MGCDEVLSDRQLSSGRVEFCQFGSVVMRWNGIKSDLMGSYGLKLHCIEFDWIEWDQI